MNRALLHCFSASMFIFFNLRNLGDTRSEYDTTGSITSECPIFEQGMGTQPKEFQFCDSVSNLMDFCSGDNSWVRESVMEMVHGVNNFNELISRIPDGQAKYSYLMMYVCLMDYLASNCNLYRVKLFKDRGIGVKPVDMIIDIGNSRTSALLFEGNFTKVETLGLLDFGSPIGVDGRLNRSQESFDMRIAFDKVDFGPNKSGSKQFCWPSVVRLGDEAIALTYRTMSAALGVQEYSTYSSPKRYLWDEKPREKEWKCVPRDNSTRPISPWISGVSEFFNEDGSINHGGRGAGCRYSRKSLMTMAFMEIVTQAIVQINSEEYRKGKGDTSIPRQLQKIVMTCPTGMSKSEQKAFHECLKDALYVLSKQDNLGMADVKIVPDLDNVNDDNPQWMYDEATCSQFVYLYNLMTETYKNCESEFYQIYGKERNGKKNVVIGSVDIGAGTSDVMVCRYEYDKSSSSKLKPEPLFWDSFDKAGDDMLNNLISNVLLQGEDGQIEQMFVDTLPDIRGRMHHFLGRNHAAQTYADQQLRRDFNLQVLVPVMYEFLKLLSAGEGSKDLTYQDIFSKIEPSSAVIDKFKNVFGFDLKDIKWKYDKTVVSKYITRSMDDLIHIVSAILASFDCDIILLSGRPSSLEPIRDLFLKYMPVAPNRLISLNKCRMENWYPFLNATYRTINNSKSIVPIGAMLGYLASNKGGYNGFALDLSLLGSKLEPTTRYFKEYGDRTNHESFITPAQNQGKVAGITNFPIFIGSAQYDSPVYPYRPFYLLDVNYESIRAGIKSQHPDWTEAQLKNQEESYINSITHNTPLTVEMSRPDPGDDIEKLIIEDVQDNDGNQLQAGDFKLEIQSLNDPDCYWLDSGVFEINIGNK